MRIAGDWLDAPATRAVCAALTAQGDRALFVGGCVRNALLGRPVADIDIATDAPPERTITLAEAAGLHPVPTGLAHGTITVVADHRPYEVTTFRRDVETTGRHAVVAFTTDVVEDARRRDFTMNALYADPDGEVVDPLGGLPDLLARRVRFVGDPAERITEDYLRILRFFRIHAWYGDPSGGIDPEGLAACAALQDGLERLSRERVGAETGKLLAADDPAPAVAAMAATGILARLLPGADATALAPLIHVEAMAGVAPDWRRRLAALGGDAGSAETLRLSRADARAVAAIRSALADGLACAASAWRHGADAGRDAALIVAAATGSAPPADLAAELARGAAARLPLAAADLDLEGPALGAALRRAEAAWLATDLRLDANAVRAAALRPAAAG
ncbi:MAG: CCA tRNA nucleotidyltransferase [Amaricoccus sp.]|uniref:CCA tRNA nucleotidyltransferase n=1 Tax=Amaricoccus sp. TaxID=1872485 RepID=UPI0039E6F983